MALVLKDRVRETTAVIGTNDATLLGAVTGFQAFSAVGSGNTCYYTISDQAGSNWEVGIGTYNTVGPTLTRDTILSSSNSGSKVNFPSGTKDVFLTYPSEKAVYLDASGNIVISGGITLDGDLYVNGNTTLGNSTADTVTLTGTVQPGVVISGSSSGDALRITQVGAGNALVVEDSANPDSTPFVVNTNGTLIVGATSSQPITGTAYTDVQVTGTGGSNGITISRWQATSGGPFLGFKKSRSTTVGTPGIVQDGDMLGQVTFYGDDGVQGIFGAQVAAYVDGTPGTNDMPGRLVFSTTADGASTLTERMRINSSGNIGLGGSGASSVTFYNQKNITGSTTAYANYTSSTVSSDVTTAAYGYRSLLSTTAASFTLSTLAHFRVGQGTIGAGSSVTTQYAYYCDDTLTGATNNYGFFSNIASGTGRWNFYAAGTADNFFAGNVGIGGTDSSVKLYVGGSTSTVANISGSNSLAASLAIRATNAAAYPALSLSSWVAWTTAKDVGQFRFDGLSSTGAYAEFAAIYATAGTNTATGAPTSLRFNTSDGTNNAATERMRIDSAGRVGIGGTTLAYGQVNISGTYPTNTLSSHGLVIDGTIPSNAATYGAGALFSVSTANNATVTPVIRGLYVIQGTITGGSRGTVTTQVGCQVEATLTGATNNYGFISGIAAGTGRYNFYASGTADNYFAGSFGVKALPSAGINILSGGNYTGSVYSYGNYANGTIQSDVTNTGSGYVTALATQAAAFTLANMPHFWATQSTIGAGSTVTLQMGFKAESSLTGATNNFGFYSALSAASGRYNFYAAGSADNYFAGRVGIGVLPSGANTLYIGLDLTGDINAQAVSSFGQIKSDVTGTAQMFRTNPTTAAAAFTLGGLVHFSANQSTIGAGSAITNQYGFAATSNLTGATNNYGVHSNIAFGTGRWNFYAGGTASNYMAGALGLGLSSFTVNPYGESPLFQSATSSGGQAILGRYSNDNFASTMTFVKTRNTSGLGTPTIVQSGDRIGQVVYAGADGTAYREAALVAAEVDGTPGASDMPGRLVFYTTADGASAGTERMRIDSAGRVGIGSTSITNYNLKVFKPLTGSTTAFSISTEGIVQSDVTSNAIYYSTEAVTAAASFTISNLHHYRATQGTIGAGSAVTNQYGFRVESTLTGATNNYGFYSNIASGTGRWNFYAAGSARNYFAGATLFGDYIEAITNATAGTGVRITTPSGSGSPAILQFTNNPVTAQWASIVSPAANVLAFKDGGDVERMRIDSSGNVLVTSSGGLGYGTGSGGAVTQTTSRTTGVTLNKTNGAITLVSAAGSTTVQSFTVTNSTVAATDTIIINQKSGTDLYEIHITAVAAGSFRVSFKTTGGTTTEQPVFNFAVIKAVAA